MVAAQQAAEVLSGSLMSPMSPASVKSAGSQVQISWYSHPLHLCGAGDQQGTTPGRPVHGHLLPPYHLEVKHGS